VTLPELLVVLAIISMAVTVAVPLIAGAIRSANARAAANGFAMNLRAARMLAVSANAPLEFTVRAEPHGDCYCTPSWYEYPGRDGRVRRFEMPTGVSITSSTDPIVFSPNGSVRGGSHTEIRTQLTSGGEEVWTIDSTPTGFSRVTMTREP
jgi:prepilin-type N-terminal cleavage/methylation domain-containing protein